MVILSLDRLRVRMKSNIDLKTEFPLFQVKQTNMGTERKSLPEAMQSNKSRIIRIKSSLLTKLKR